MPSDKEEKFPVRFYSDEEIKGSLRARPIQGTRATKPNPAGGQLLKKGKIRFELFN